MQTVEEFAHDIARDTMYSLLDLKMMVVYAQSTGHGAAHPKMRALLREIERREMAPSA